MAASQSMAAIGVPSLVQRVRRRALGGRSEEHQGPSAGAAGESDRWARQEGSPAGRPHPPVPGADVRIPYRDRLGGPDPRKSAGALGKDRYSGDHGCGLSAAVRRQSSAACE